jgi:hypothetical protein
MRGRAQAGSAPRRSAVMRVGRESGAHRWTSGFKQRRGQRRPCRRREAGCSEPACGRGRCKLMWHRSAAPSWTARSLITLGFRLEAAPISWPTQLQVGARVSPAACGVPRRACLPAWEPLGDLPTVQTAEVRQQCGELLSARSGCYGLARSSRVRPLKSDEAA